jgi:hypothetical protein
MVGGIVGFILCLETMWRGEMNVMSTRESWGWGSGISLWCVWVWVWVGGSLFLRISIRIWKDGIWIGIFRSFIPSPSPKYH